VVRTGLDAADDAAAARLATLRTAMEGGGQFIAAAKHVLGTRGVPVGPGMRAPLRRLTNAEAQALDEAVASFLVPA